MPREKIKVSSAEYDLVQREDGFHLFDASFVHEKPEPKRVAPPKALCADPNNRVRLVEGADGKLIFVED